jgi:hypothetical protein
MGTDTDSASQVEIEEQTEEHTEEEGSTVVEALFAIMGDYGNNIMIYSSDSIILKHQIHVGHVVRSF